MSSKIDHKELQKRLKEDEMTVYIQELKENTQRIYNEYGTQILLGIAIVVLAFVAFYLWRASSHAAFEESQLLLGNASNLMQQENYQQAITQLDQLLDQYSSSNLAPSAYLLRGEAYTNLGQHEQALEAYRNALPNLSGNDKLAAQIAIVQSLRNLGQSEQALNELQPLIESVTSDGMKYYLSYLKGNCHEDLDQSEQAIEAYSQMPVDSTWYSMAQSRVEWLNAQPVTAIN